MGLRAKGINGVLVFDGTTVTIDRGKTADGMMNLGRAAKTYPMSSIAAIQHKPATAMFNGHIQFSVAGESSKRHRLGSINKDMMRDENAILFRNGAKDDFDAIYTAIKAAQASPNSGIATQAPDVMGQLEQRGKLRDSGVLTEEKFNSKQAALLDRL